MSDAARMKRLGIDHLSPAEQLAWMEKRIAVGRQQEARAADQQKQAAQQQAEEETFIQQ